MAVTSAAIAGVKRNSTGSLTEVTRLVTFDSSYVTGGEPLAASAFGLKRIFQARAQLVSNFSATVAHADALPQTDGSLLLRLRAAAGTEVPNATNVATVTARVIVQGA